MRNHKPQIILVFCLSAVALAEAGLLSLVALPSLVALLPLVSLPALAAQDSPAPSTPFDVGVKIPGLQFGTPYKEGNTTVIPYLAQYISAAYRYMIGIAVIAAIVMIMWGGFRYMVGSTIGDAKAGKEIIQNAVSGLVILFAAYLILKTVNPATLNLKLAIEDLPYVPVEQEDSGDTATDLAPDAYQPPDVYCPGSGGSETLSRVVQSLKGKVTYRWGGNGKPPPPNYPEKKSQFLQYANFCPPDTLCLDCSHFVKYVEMCAGLPKMSGNTDIFQNAEAITSIDPQNATVNGVSLKPGDLIGYTAAESTHGSGHVLIYIGQGRFAQSAGGDKGRQSGANPVLTRIPKDNTVYKHIIRVSL